MKRFIRDVIVLILPIILMVMVRFPFYIVATRCGEFKTIQDNIAVQRENREILIGLGYNEQTRYYKLVNANYYKADILALGTSRVMQFKEVFFEKDFYNCGGAVAGNYNEYVNFLKNLEYKPECILLGLDTWVFNDAWNQSCADYSNFGKIEEIYRSKRVMLESIMSDWMKRKWNFNSLKDYPDNIGFNGRIKDSGFMYDGSYYEGYRCRHPEEQEDYLFADTFDRIETGTGRFEWGDYIDQDTLVQLENLLSYCAENDIEVVGFITPFAPTVYETMRDSGNYGYLTQIEAACKELFDEYNFEVHNYMDGSCLNVTDDYFLDGFHGSEIVYGYILEDMVSKGSKIDKYVDPCNTHYLLENAYDGRTFYDPDARNTD